MAKLLIRSGAKVSNVQCDEAILDLAIIYSSDLKLIEMLVGGSPGCDVNFIERCLEITPLMRAIMEKKYDIAELLLELGADVSISDDQDYKAVHYAADDIKMLQLLILYGADPEATGSKKYGAKRPLHFACANYNVEVVRFLVKECGVDVKAKDIWGKEAFSYVPRDSSSRDEIFEILGLS